MIIKGSSIYVPSKQVSNDYYEKKFSKEAGWIEQRAGIKGRYVSGEDETTSSLAIKAVKPLIEQADGEIDFLLCATSSPDSLLPPTANKISRGLGLSGSLFCFDISAACSGFLFAMEMANVLLKSGSYKRGIIVGADKITPLVNQDDPYTSPLFGEAAGAFLVEASNDSRGVVASYLSNDSNGTDKLYIKSGGAEFPITKNLIEENAQYVQMQGKDVFANAVKQMSDSIYKVLEMSKTTLTDVDMLIPHQANARITAAVSKKLNCSSLDICNIIEDYGNIVNASIPVAYHLNKDKIEKYSNLVFVAFGGGYNYGAIQLHR